MKEGQLGQLAPSSYCKGLHVSFVRNCPDNPAYELYKILKIKLFHVLTKGKELNRGCDRNLCFSFNVLSKKFL